MDDINIEQPVSGSVEQAAGAEVADGSIVHTETGSSLDKFKDSEALMQAYNSLQSEFTRKCQALSDLQKKYADNSDLPVYLREDWRARVDAFMEQNASARDYSKEISEIIMSDKAIAESSNPLEEAWVSYMKSNFVARDKVLEDNEFIQNYVLNNDKVKDMIIKQYLQNIETNKAPALISGHSGSVAPMTPPIAPKSLEEAADIARAMLKK